MKIKGNGWSALILAAGLCVCFVEPPQAMAATDTAGASSTAGAPIALSKYTRHGSRHGRRYAHHKSGKVALKAADDKNDKKAAADVAANDSGKSPTPPTSSEIPSSVANANAQLATSDSPSSDAAQAMSVRAGNIVQNAANNPAETQPAAEDQVVAPDQLNDVDRALHQGNNAPVAPFAVASAEPPVASAAASVMTGSAARSSSDNTWDQTSLIGKIFIGFGALLTMASAARMFMA